MPEEAEPLPGVVNAMSGHAHFLIQAGLIGGDVNVDPVQEHVNLVTGLPAETRYREQVARLAPLRLADREQELAELTEFCTSPSTMGAYRWWQAEAWAGKSALMAWFVLHPPERVRVVSFFVTVRLLGQSDRAAFIDNLLEQLLILLDVGLPPFLAESTREA